MHCVTETSLVDFTLHGIYWAQIHAVSCPSMGAQIALEFAVLVTRRGAAWEIIITTGFVSEEMPPAERAKLEALSVALTKDVKLRLKEHLQVTS